MIVYILILTTCLRRLALWKAQRGAILGDLEQIQASISLPATLKAIWSLRHFTLRSCGLVAVWSFYYLGTVACRDEYRFENYGPPETLQVSYMNFSAPSLFQKASHSFESPVKLYDVHGQFYTYTQMGGTGMYESYSPTNDFMGAPYQPWIEQLEGSTPSHHGWMDATGPNTFQPASQMGLQMTVPIDNMYMGGTWPLGFDCILGTFPINSTYIAVDCQDPDVLQSPAVSSKSESSVANSHNLTLEMVEKASGDGPMTPRAIRLSASVDGQHLQYICMLTTTAIEMLVSCDLQGCRPVMVRRTPGAPSSSPRTVFDDDQFATAFLTDLAQIAGDDIAWYMGDSPESNFYVTRQVMEDMNTLYTSSQQVDDINENYIETLSIVGQPYFPHYEIYWPWIAVDIVSCLILFLAALTSSWLRTQTLAPDIFGYVSSLTRENPHLNLPESGSCLSGLDRARLLKKLKIQILDVGTADQVGHVGVRLVDSETGGLNGHLRKEKFYL